MLSNPTSRALPARGKSLETERLFVKQILNPYVGWVRHKYLADYNI